MAEKKKLIAKNRTANFEYSIDETFEAGIVLVGTEVRSIRERGAQITDSFILIRKGEAWLHNVYIHPYSHGNRFNVDSDRPRKLLLHKRQIRHIEVKVKEKGFAVVPLDMYFDENNRVKLTIGVGKGKKLYDKRADMAKRDSEREVARALKEQYR